MNRGILQHSQLCHVWKDCSYTLYSFFLKLLENFDLIIQVPISEKEALSRTMKFFPLGRTKSGSANSQDYSTEEKTGATSAELSGEDSETKSWERILQNVDVDAVEDASGKSKMKISSKNVKLSPSVIKKKGREKSDDEATVNLDMTMRDSSDSYSAARNLQVALPALKPYQKSLDELSERLASPDVSSVLQKLAAKNAQKREEQMSMRVSEMEAVPTSSQEVVRRGELDPEKEEESKQTQRFEATLISSSLISILTDKKSYVKSPRRLNSGDNSDALLKNSGHSSASGESREVRLARKKKSKVTDNLEKKTHSHAELRAGGGTTEEKDSEDTQVENNDEIVKKGDQPQAEENQEDERKKIKDDIRKEGSQSMMLTRTNVAKEDDKKRMTPRTIEKMTRRPSQIKLGKREKGETQEQEKGAQVKREDKDENSGNRSLLETSEEGLRTPDQMTSEKKSKTPRNSGDELSKDSRRKKTSPTDNKKKRASIGVSSNRVKKGCGAAAKNLEPLTPSTKEPTPFPSALGEKPVASKKDEDEESQEKSEDEKEPSEGTDSIEYQPGLDLSGVSIVPALLPTRIPKEMAFWMRSLWPEFPQDVSEQTIQLHRSFSFAFIPKGLFSRLIVRILKLCNLVSLWGQGILAKTRDGLNVILVEHFLDEYISSRSQKSSSGLVVSCFYSHSVVERYQLSSRSSVRILKSTGDADGTRFFRYI